MGKIIGLFFVLCVILLCYTIVTQFQLSLRMLPVEGELATVTGSTQRDISYTHGTHGVSGANSYNITVHYSYVVNGITYQGKILTLKGNYFASEKVAEIYINKYINSDKVTVWYDPKNPRFAVLEKPAVDTSLWIIIPVLLVLAFLSFRYLDVLFLKLQRLGRNN